MFQVQVQDVQVYPKNVEQPVNNGDLLQPPKKRLRPGLERWGMQSVRSAQGLLVGQQGNV